MLIRDFSLDVQNGMCVIVCLLLTGCARAEVPVPTRTTSFQNRYTFSRPFDQMWDIALQTASTYQATVNASDRASGVLTFSFSSQTSSRHVTLWLTASSPDKTTVRVRVLLSDGSDFFPSDGTVEEGILRDLQRASQESR